MNLNDKNIDQVFRDAAQNSDAPRYDHSYWKEMNSILNEEDKRKRGFILWSVAGSVIAAMLVFTLFITNKDNSDTLIVDNSNKAKKSIHNNDHQNKLDENSTVANQTVKNGNDTEHSNIENNNIQGENQSVSSAKTEENSITTPSAKDNETILASRQQSHTEFKSNKSDHVITENRNNLSDNNKKEVNSIESLALKVVRIEQTEPNKELIPLRLQNDKALRFYAKLSAGLMENYETSRPFQSGLFDLSLNLEYSKEQVLFRTGLGVQATSNADLVISERAKVYGFGITTHQNNLSYQSLYDIYIPVEIGYSLNNTSFGFGGQFNYMFGTTMNYESLENNVVVSNDKLKGFSEGLNTFTAQGYVWLEQKLTNRFSAGVKVGTNLNSRINEGRYFNESSTTNPLYGQLTLRFNLN